MKVAVVGSGMGGLSAALQIARAGHEVDVFEAHETLGGKVGYTTIDGVKCDTGPSLLTMQDVVTTLLGEQTLEFVTPDPEFTYHWPDGVTLRFSGKAVGALEEIGRILGPAAADEARSFFSYVETIWTHAAPSFVYADAPSFFGIAKMPLREIVALRKIDSMRSMLRGISEHVTEPHLVDIFARFATYNGSDPRVAPATLNCIAHVEIALGGLGISGGYYGLTDALVDACAELDVRFHCLSPVERIIVNEGRAQGVIVSGESHPFDAVVSNVDVSHLQAGLLDKTADDFEPSMSGWNAIVKSNPDTIPDAHTVFFPANYMREFEDIFDARTLPTDPTVYVCNQASAHNVRFDDGDVPLFLMINAPPDPTLDCSVAWERVSERLRSFDVNLDEPIWIRTPGELAEQFPGSNGALYGASSNNRFAAFKRAANKHSSIDGLYIASGTAHPGGGVPMCLLSGTNAAKSLLGED